MTANRKLMSSVLVALGILASVVFIAGGSAVASSLTWTFSSPTGDVGSNTHTYMDSTSVASITAHGYQTANGFTGSTLGTTWSTGTVTATNLYGKVTAGDPSETGLGLASLDTADHEIQNASFVQLDLSFLETNHYSGLSVSVSSIQAAEGFYVWGSGTLGTAGTLLYMGTNPLTGGLIQTVSDPTFLTYKYISISATHANLNGDSDVLILDGLSVNPVGAPPVTPLPASVWSGGALFGLLAAGRIARRRAKLNNPVRAF